MSMNATAIHAVMPPIPVITKTEVTHAHVVVDSTMILTEQEVQHAPVSTVHLVIS